MRYIRLYEELSLKKFVIIKTINNTLHLIRIIGIYKGEPYITIDGGELSRDMIEAISIFNFADGKIYPGKPGSIKFYSKDVDIEYESDDYDDADERFKILIDAKKYNL